MEEKKEQQPQQSAFSIIWQDIMKNRRLYYVVLSITFVLSVIIALSIPNYYKCTVKLAPELNGAKSGGGLSSIASSFGINLGGANAGTDAINPTLYPDLMNSVTFKASLFPVKVQRNDDDSTMTYYDYLLNHQKQPWWTSAIGAIKSMVNGQRSMVNEKVDPFKLTPAQASIITVMNSKVVCDVDMTTNVITIDVTDQDPLIAATMADSVQVHLQEFITDYRTSKARIDLAYNQKLFKETKARYEQARKRYASYSDGNQRVFLESVLSQKAALEHEMQLQYSAYQQVASQLLAAEAKVQQETPAFTLLQPATVPIIKAGPSRKNIVFVFLFLALIFTTLYIIYREGDFKTILASLRQKSPHDMFDDDELMFISRLLSNQEKHQESR